MARPIDPLTARRIQRLARCQKLREDQARAVALVSARGYNAAEVQLQNAHQLLAQHVLQGANSLHTAWDEISGIVVTPDMLDALRRQEARFQDEVRSLSFQAADAATALKRAEADLEAAQMRLGEAARLCRKREALAERSAAELSRTFALAEDLITEDEILRSGRAIAMAIGRGGAATSHRIARSRTMEDE